MVKQSLFILLKNWIIVFYFDAINSKSTFCFLHKDVSAPFKIFSTLIRGLDSEMALINKDGEFSKESTSASAGKSEGDYDEDERLEAEDGEELQEEKDDKIEVDLNVIQDEEENDIQKRFAVRTIKIFKRH